MPKIAVVILNYNGATLLHDLLPHVIANSPQAEVIVADNASTDNSISVLKNEFPSVRRIELEQNFGFAEGYNRALAQVKADYFVLLNSDVDVEQNWLEPLLDFAENNRNIAAIQPKILSYRNPKSFEYAGAAGGYIDWLGYPFCRGRIFSTIETDEGQYDTIADIFWATGACLFVRAEAFWAVGGLDGRFFAHQEEIDFCWRLRARGYRIACVPQSRVYHIGAKTLAAEHPQKTYLNFRNNWLMIYKNDRNATKILVLRWFLDQIAALQMLFRRKTANFWAVQRAHRDFFCMRKDFFADRQKNIQLTENQKIKEQFSGSILWSYYICGKRLARKLQW